MSILTKSKHLGNASVALEGLLRLKARKLSVLLTTALIFLSLCSAAISAQYVSVFVEGNQLNDRGIILNSNVMVPMRSIFEALGAAVSWDGAARTITATKDDKEIKLILGYACAYINGKRVPLKTPALSFNGSTLVPLRFVGEALNSHVRWDSLSKSVFVAGSANWLSADSMPTLKEVILSPNVPMRAGQTLKVTIIGEGGCLAYFDVVGLQDNIPMAEEREGIYVGYLMVNRSMNISKAQVIGRLCRPNSNTIARKTAQDTLTIKQVSSVGGLNPFLTGVSPEPNEIIYDSCPSIVVNLANEVQVGALRLFLDEMEYTAKSNYGPKNIALQLRNDLQPGYHKVRISGQDLEGNSLDFSWKFKLAINKVQDKGLFVKVLSPHNGNSVSSSVTISGKATPLSTVVVTSFEDLGTASSIANSSGHRTTKNTMADSDGEFVINLDLSFIRSGHRVELQFYAIDPSGNEQSPNVIMHLTRQ